MIDYDKLRRDMEDNAYGAYFAGGIGAGLVEAAFVEEADDEELVELAKQMGMDIEDYED